MSTIQYPSNAHSKEVDVWLQIKIRETVNSFEKGNFGKLKETIRILAPQSLEDNHGQRYGGSTFKIASALDLSSGWESFTVAGRELIGGAFSPIIGDIGKAGWQTGSNPWEQKVYEAPDFRTFTFRWEFSPLNSKDSKSLEDIIQKLTKASYPIGESEGIWTFPDQFELLFVSLNEDDEGGTPAKLPIKFGKCVLTNIATNYTGAGHWRTSLEGKPSFVNLSLTFSETNLKEQEFFDP